MKIVLFFSGLTWKNFKMNYEEALKIVRKWDKDPAYVFPSDFSGWRLFNPRRGKCIAHIMAEKGKRMPESFDDWLHVDPSGRSMAHVAALSGTPLPDDFNAWALLDKHGWSVAMCLVYAGTPLPADFKEWDIRDKDSAEDSIAHHLAMRNRLPEDFDRYEIRNRYGDTVAHKLAQYSHPFPENFTAWDLMDNAGRTVAHCVAQFDGVFHPAFNLWDLRNRDGETVLEYARKNGSLKVLAQYNASRIREGIETQRPAEFIARNGI